MEDSQFTEGAARTDTSDSYATALLSLFQVFGGVLAIAVSAAIIMLSSAAVFWIRTSLLDASSVLAHYASLIDSSVSIVVTFGLTAKLLVEIYRALPERLGQIHDALVQGAGLVLLVNPTMMVRVTIVNDGPILLSRGIETPFWFVYFLVGVLFLLQPRLRKSNRAAKLPPRALPALVFSLGLLVAVLAFDQIWAITISGTIYSAFLIASPVVVIVSTIIDARLPERHGAGATVFS